MLIRERNKEEWFEKEVKRVSGKGFLTVKFISEEKFADNKRRVCVCTEKI